MIAATFLDVWLSALMCLIALVAFAVVVLLVVERCRARRERRRLAPSVRDYERWRAERDK